MIMLGVNVLYKFEDFRTYSSNMLLIKIILSNSRSWSNIYWKLWMCPTEILISRKSGTEFLQVLGRVLFVILNLKILKQGQ
jgi:hypothetical protein